MTDRDISDVRSQLVHLITRRTASGEAASAVARAIYSNLAVVLVPLVSAAGFDALVARAFQLAQREYPPAESADDGIESDAFVKIGLWLDRQDQRNTINATAAMFAAVAALLVTLIGDSLTTRYLRKAWPDAFSDGRPKGKEHD